MQDHSKPHIRRLVTGHDPSGEATTWLDAEATNHKFPGEGISSTLMWVTDSSPADFLTTEDGGERILGTAPPANGTRFTVMEFHPGHEVHGFHRTDTVDYVICISGSIDMDLDDGTVTMHPGDIMVQLGTNHRWVNRGKELCRLAVILIDGEPKRPDSVAIGNASAQ
jgi:mannose-6-phosphate isomerase-like protein (cupin superfamily)